MKETLFNRIREGVKDVFYIWAREMRASFKDEGIIIFFLLVPFLYPLLYGWAYSGEVVREVPVAVVDLSHTHQSRQFIREFDASPNTRVAYHCMSIDEARELVGKQVVHGILYFPPDFQTLTNRMEQAHVGVYCDMAFMLTYKAIYQTAQAVASDMNTKLQISLSGNQTNREDEISTQPLAFDEVAIYNPAGGYGSFLIPAVLILIIQQTLLLGIGLAAGTARENNPTRDLVPCDPQYSGVFRIVFGKLLVYVMIYAIVTPYLTLVVPRIFNFVTLLSWKPLLYLMIPYVLACALFGMMLSCIVKYRENVILIVVFTSIPFLFLTGTSWPETAIPGVWRSIAWILPSTFGVRGFIRLNTMGADLGDVITEYHALWIQVGIYFIMTCAVYRHQIWLAHKHEKMMLEEENDVENYAEND